MLLRNITWLSTEYTALYHRWYNCENISFEYSEWVFRTIYYRKQRKSMSSNFIALLFSTGLPCTSRYYESHLVMSSLIFNSISKRGQFLLICYSRPLYLHIIISFTFRNCDTINVGQTQGVIRAPFVYLPPSHLLPYNPPQCYFPFSFSVIWFFSQWHRH